jgi:hypothetical protein
MGMVVRGRRASRQLRVGVCGTYAFAENAKGWRPTVYAVQRGGMGDPSVAEQDTEFDDRGVRGIPPFKERREATRVASHAVQNDSLPGAHLTLSGIYSQTPPNKRYNAICAGPATIAACSILGNRKQLATG